MSGIQHQAAGFLKCRHLRSRLIRIIVPTYVCVRRLACPEARDKYLQNTMSLGALRDRSEEEVALLSKITNALIRARSTKLEWRIASTILGNSKRSSEELRDRIMPHLAEFNKLARVDGALWVQPLLWQEMQAVLAA